MKSPIAFLFHAALALATCAAVAQSTGHAASPPAAAAAAAHAPTYLDGKLQLPSDYREWIYVTTGMDMSYRSSAAPGHHMFDNVFVNPEAWRVFKATGTWPEHTMMVLEARGARDKGSINQRGFFQDADLMGIEVHVKDSARFDGGWAFFTFDDDKPAREVDHAVECYACHRTHAAVDTTFVQFYPTLLPIAKAAGTLSASYLEDLKKAE